MAERVVNGFAYDAFVKGGYVQNEETILEVLEVIAKIDGVPDVLLEQEVSLPKIQTLLRRTRHLTGAILKHDLSLAQMSAKPGFRSKQDERRIRDALVSKKLRVSKQLFMGQQSKRAVAGL